MTACDSKQTSNITVSCRPRGSQLNLILKFGEIDILVGLAYERLIQRGALPWSGKVYALARMHTLSAEASAPCS